MTTESSLWFDFKEAQVDLWDRKEFLEGAETLLREAAELPEEEIDEELRGLREEKEALQKAFEERREVWYRDYCKKFVKKIN